MQSSNFHLDSMDAISIYCQATKPAKAMLFGVPSNRRVTYFQGALGETPLLQTAHWLLAASGAAPTAGHDCRELGRGRVLSQTPQLLSPWRLLVALRG